MYGGCFYFLALVGPAQFRNIVSGPVNIKKYMKIMS